MSTNSSTFLVTLNTITLIIPTAINFFSATVGVIGGICNLITFTSSKIRQNSCVFYLLCATIFQILSIMVIIPTRIALDNFGNNLENESVLFCKLRYYCTLTLPALETYYMLFAITDRYLATSNRVRVRSWSQLKVAHRSSIILCIAISAGTSHALVFYDISNNACLVPSTGAYTIIFAIYLIFVLIALPHTFMFIFSLLTFINLRQTRLRISPMLSGATNLRTRRLESQLVKIIIIQVILSTLLVSFRLGTYIYQIMSSADLNKTPESRALAAFILRLSYALYYFSFAISFYVSTLTSHFFRDIFRKQLLSFVRFCCH